MPRPAAPALTVSSEFPLWGGRAVVAVTEPAGLDAALARVKRTVEAFDLACSSFREDSELAALHRSAGEWVGVSRLLYDAVAAAVGAAEATDGVVDPTVGPVLVARGITPPLVDTAIEFEAVAGHTVVELDERGRRVRLPPGVRLDLGATAKALAADRAALAASAAAGCGALVSLCGDISVVGDAPAGGWAIRVTDDHRRGDAPGQTVAIQTGALATSSITVRRAGIGADSVSHLLDPRSGQPVQGPWRTVSVTGSSCLEANTASTAAIVLGEQAPAWLEARGLPARLVALDGSVLHLSGWPEAGEEL